MAQNLLDGQNTLQPLLMRLFALFDIYFPVSASLRPPHFFFMVRALFISSGVSAQQGPICDRSRGQTNR